MYAREYRTALPRPAWLTAAVWSVGAYGEGDYRLALPLSRYTGFMLNLFFTDGEDVYRTYSTTARGVDRLLFVNNILDLAPYGRQEDWEDSPEGWPQSPTYG